MLIAYQQLFEIMEVLGKKWIVPMLLVLLVHDQVNFSALKKQLKITSRALSMNLKLLETLGFIEKICLHDTKKAVYALSETGKEVTQKIIDFQIPENE